ncbi:MAG: NAD-dependent epimerase/dehydratase family protein [Bacteroidetes bacterium]|nr:MAG: NAD-dependent epimerase/dehydratase family protein [Bacteroidota bacterium]
MKKKILVLGGTQFIGRSLVEKLFLEKNFEITLFNRHKTGINLFEDIPKIRGDRETPDINKIKDHHWDYVIDLSGYYPDSLKNVLDNLNPDVSKYIFISTCSVYDNEQYQLPMRDENAPILSCSEKQYSDRTVTSYGNRKAECERILMDSGINYFIFRPALVYGPYDHTDRLYYWLYQVKKGGPLLLPDKGQGIFSLTYVKDLVEVITRALSKETPNNTYNVISQPKSSIRMIVEEAASILKKDFREVNASPSFLNIHNVAQWTDMPLWLDCNYYTYENESMKKDFNFSPQPFQESLNKTIQFYDKLNWPVPKYGMAESTKMGLISHLAN